MSTPSGQPHIFVSAAEPSADLHAASLVRAVRARCPEARFTGVAGPRMRQAGCESVFDMTAHSSMLMGAFGHVHHGYRMLALSKRVLESQRFNAAVAVDSPILNLRVSRRAKSLQVPVLYYIAPQLWAWAGSLRINAVRAGVDRIACLLPFEEPYFRSYGVEANYVGHPLFATLAAHQLDSEAVERLRQGGGSVLAILPGSRRHVVTENFPSQLKVAQALRSRFNDLKVLVSIANPQVRPLLADLSRAVSIPIEFHEGQNAELLRAADLALVVSGTITLEAAYHRTPMIVMYNSSRLMYQLVRVIISTRFYSLPNILADRELVPEFMPYYTSVEPIIARAAALLSDATARQRVSAALADLVKPFMNMDAADTTAKILLDLIESRPRSSGG